MSPQPSLRISRALAAGTVLGAVVWLLLRQRYFYGWVDDDAFISFRYARNLADGHGLVFNIGERVEGYTNFLWTVILALLYKLGADLPNAARSLGALCSVATVAVLLAFSRTRLFAAPDALPPGARPWLVLVAPLVLCFSDAWAAWAAGGLENTLSALLVSGGLLTYVRATEAASESGFRHALLMCAFALALAVLNHPTNSVFLVPVVLHGLTRLRMCMARGSMLAALLVFVAIVGAWTAWRLVYYGDLLPNTFYAKVGFTRFVWMRGLRYLLEILRALPFAYAVVVALGWLAVRRTDIRFPFALMGGACLLYTAYIVQVGGEQFPALRGLVVLLPLFALLVQRFAYELCRGGPGRTNAGQSAVAMVVVLFVVAAHALPLYASPRVRILDEALRLGRTALSTTAALRLKELLPPDTLFAHSGAGLIAFYTNFPWIDTLGLTDKHIARTPVENMGRGAAGHEKGDGAYVWSRQPDFIMFPGYPISNRMPGTKGGRELFAIPQFRATYRSVTMPFEFQGPQDDRPRSYVLHLWQRVGAPGPSSR